MTPSLGLINLLVWLTELSETCCLLDHQFITKAYNSATARWKRYLMTSHGDRTQGFHALSERAILPKCRMFTNQEALRILAIWVFMEALLHRHDWLNHWPLATDWTSSSFALLGGQGMGFIWIFKYFTILLLVWIEWFSITKCPIFYFHIFRIPWILCTANKS